MAFMYILIIAEFAIICKYVMANSKVEVSYMSPIIERVLDLMSERNITALKLTSDLAISHTSISDWKKGRGTPKVNTLTEIAKYFNVSLDYLVTGMESKNYPIPFATGRDKILIKKFHKLPVEVQQEVLAFIDFKIAQSIDKSSKQYIS